MKKVLFGLAIATLSSTAMFAQKGAKLNKAATATTTQSSEQPTSNDGLTFTKETHDFGNVKEGDPAVYEFQFKNNTKKSITINNASASCGCTVPEWPKEPIAPGKTGKIKVSYSTQGRPGAINKNVNITTTEGSQTLYIKGHVTSAPKESVEHNASTIHTK